MLCIPLNLLLSDHLGFRILWGIEWQLILRAVGANVVVAGVPYFLNFCSSLFICINFLLPQSSVMPSGSVLAAVAPVSLQEGTCKQGMNPLDDEILIFPTYAEVFIPMSRHFWLWYPNCIVTMEVKLWSQVQDKVCTRLRRDLLVLPSGKGRTMVDSTACKFRRGDVHFCLLKSVEILPLASQGEIGLNFIHLNSVMSSYCFHLATLFSSSLMSKIL